MENQSFFEKNLSRAIYRSKSNKKESIYVNMYIPTLINHLRDLKSQNPDITEEEMQAKIFDEIDDYSLVVYDSTYAFALYMDYICCRYLQLHPDKYTEISNLLFSPRYDFNKFVFDDCSSFEDYLCFYLYNLKQDLFNIIYDGYGNGSQEDYKNLDNLLKEDIKNLSESFFGNNYDLPQISEILSSSTLDKKSKLAKIKEFSTWYNSALDRKKFLIYANIFLNGPYSYIAADQEILEKDLRRDLANSTANIVNHLESLHKFDGYLISYVHQMINLGIPELAMPFCDSSKANPSYLNSLKSLSPSMFTQALSQVIAPEKLKQYLSVGYLSSSKNISLEALLAISSFWSNRYVKELDDYSKAMFAIHDLGLIKKIINGENVNISISDISQILIKMDTFYKPALNFIERKQYEVLHSSNDEQSDNHVIRYSYDPFINNMCSRFGNEYEEYFSEKLPKSNNNLKENLDWYLRLRNPIISSYSLKDLNINGLVASIENSYADFPNAGVILNNLSDDGTYSDLPFSIAIGIDAGLTFPIRMHTRKDILVDFLKSINYSTIIPIYAGSDDFKDPSTGKMLSASVVSPLTDKQKAFLKKAFKNIQNYDNPKLVSHLAFIDSKYTPEHLRSSYFDERGREKKFFDVKYVDLETGIIYTKSDDQFVPVSPKSNLIGGHSENVGR